MNLEPFFPMLDTRIQSKKARNARLLLTVAVGITFAATATHSLADVRMTGNDLLILLQKPHEDPLFAVGLAYVQGFADAEAIIQPYAVLGGDKSGQSVTRVCFPQRSTYAQYADVVKKFLLDHPEHRHMEQGILIHIAFLDAFSCAKISN